MKLSVNELKIVIESLETYYEYHPSQEVDEVLEKVQTKLYEVTGKESRLLSNSELKNIGI